MMVRESLNHRWGDFDVLQMHRGSCVAGWDWGLRSSQFLVTLPQADLPVDVDAADKDEDGK